MPVLCRRELRAAAAENAPEVRHGIESSRRVLALVRNAFIGGCADLLGEGRDRGTAIQVVGPALVDDCSVLR
jgi:hypothetical protein